MVSIKIHEQNLEISKGEYMNDYFVWFNLYEGVQVTVGLEWEVVETIILSHLREIYTDPDEDDSAREAIAVLTRTAFTHGEKNDDIRLAAMEKEYQQNKEAN